MGRWSPDHREPRRARDFAAVNCMGVQPLRSRALHTAHISHVSIRSPDRRAESVHIPLHQSRSSHSQLSSCFSLSLPPHRSEVASALLRAPVCGPSAPYGSGGMGGGAERGAFGGLRFAVTLWLAF